MAPTAAEASIIAEIITGVNRKLKEENADDYSSLDEEPDLPSNRGNKLKRKSVYAHEGQLYGKRLYKKKVNHAGYDRYILNKKPKRYDLEGYPLESDEEDAAADEDVADRNPYHGVNVQELLMPLTASSELWRHPGMSQAFTNDTLPDMTRKANEMLRREKETLYLVKGLATKFRGDQTHMPCGEFLDGSQSMFDVETMLRDMRAQVVGAEPALTPEAALAINVTSADGDKAFETKEEDEGTQAEDIAMVQNDAAPPATADGVAEAIASTEEQPEPDAEYDGQNPLDLGPPIQKIGVKQEPLPDQPDDPDDGMKENGEADGTAQTEGGENEDTMDQDSPVPRMVTRGAAAAANGSGDSQAGNGTEKTGARSPSLSFSTIPVHPLFIPPAGSVPDRDLGLPPPEAEEIRRLLNVFVQKQEEVVRGCERMYEMFLKANRLRNTVYRWSRAEAHVGEMSDGEEWVDQEEWALDEPLRKGAAEGEEETREEERRGKGRRRGAA